MKKLFFLVAIFFLSISSSFAVFFVDAQGDYISTGDYKPVEGGGLGVGFNINDDINFLLKGSYASKIENIDDRANKKSYQYNFVTCGIEYTPPFTFLEKYRLFWKNSINAGVSKFNVDYRVNVSGEDLKKNKNETGIFTAFRTGLQYNFTQIVAPYFDLGYQKSFLSSTSDLNIGGLQISFGVRFFIGGNRDYENGY